MPEDKSRGYEDPMLGVMARKMEEAFKVAKRTEDRSRYILCVDFDGVLHSYTSGWKGAVVVTDPPVPGAIAWLVETALDPRFEVCVYSSRSKDPGGIDAMRAWLMGHLQLHYDRISTMHAKRGAGSVLAAISFPTQKPAASMTIDDRAFCFEGTFPSAEWMLGFKPWNKR
jgi:hypothetical protein